jgi:hypothetical protein
MTLNDFMIRFAQWFFMPLSILLTILIFLRQRKKGQYSDEFVDRWAENWVEQNKEILENFD